MHRFGFVFTLFCLLLAACAAPAADIPAASPTLATRTATPSASLTPGTSTPGTPTVTPLPTIPTFTPTFDVRTIVTATPAPKAECPKELDDSRTPDFALPASLQKCNKTGNYDECFPKGTADNILKFLNEGGAIQSVISRLMGVYSEKNDNVLFQDVTGDSIPELMFMDFQQFHRFNIFVCKAGHYHLFTPETEPDFEKLYSIKDLNANGLPEIILTAGFCTGSGCTSVYAYEWNGITFNNLAPEVWISGLEKLEIKDSDKNKTDEIILVGGILGTGGYQGQIPARIETHIYKWNGVIYAPERIEKASPVYRFQAIQDADQSVLIGQIDTALTLYQKVIFSDSLSWWSPQRKEYFIIMNPWRDPKETPIPEPPSDPTEYSRLAAYAYYRMVILHTLLGETETAQVKYATLQEKFPSGNPGHPYVEMATDFWNAYQSSGLMYDACAAAIAYADAHPEILIPLGSDYHGAQSHTYTPADVCPFR